MPGGVPVGVPSAELYTCVDGGEIGLTCPCPCCDCEGEGRCDGVCGAAELDIDRTDLGRPIMPYSYGIGAGSIIDERRGDL